MKIKSQRLDTIKMIVSSKHVGSQSELLEELAKVGIKVTQATLSRDLKLLKVAKASDGKGNYVYVLPNETMYRHVSKRLSIAEMMATSGLLSIDFSGNIAVVKTRPGYAGSVAYDIDERELPEILGTIAGDDTILLVLKEGAPREKVVNALRLGSNN